MMTIESFSDSNIYFSIKVKLQTEVSNPASRIHFGICYICGFHMLNLYIWNFVYIFYLCCDNFVVKIRIGWTQNIIGKG